jgi:hypothetical protein
MMHHLYLQSGRYETDIIRFSSFETNLTLKNFPPPEQQCPAEILQNDIGDERCKM